MKEISVWSISQPTIEVWLAWLFGFKGSNLEILYHFRRILEPFTGEAISGTMPILMGIFSRKLGIDLGTANTLVFVPGKGIVLNEPSVVAVSEIDNRILAIGSEAKDMIGKTPESIIAYRPMKDGVIADYRVTEAMLRYFINKAMGKFNFFKPDIMISVPAGVTSTERRAVVEAAIKAGAKNAYVVKEPILAAIGAGIPIHESRGYMIVEIGRASCRERV